LNLWIKSLTAVPTPQPNVHHGADYLGADYLGTDHLGTPASIDHLGAPCHGAHHIGAHFLGTDHLGAHHHVAHHLGAHLSEPTTSVLESSAAPTNNTK